MTPACGSARRTGVQSAVMTPRARPGVAVTRASARGPAPGGQGVGHGGDVGAVDLGQAEEVGGAERLRRRRRGWRGRLRGRPGWRGCSSGLRTGPVLTPPRRVKKPWRMGRIGLVRASGVIRRIRGASGGKGGRRHMALNRRPMRTGSARRWAAWMRAAARAGGWVRARRSVRWNRPRRVEEDALRDGAVHGGAGGAGGLGEGGEVDMGGEVGRAGVGQRGGGSAVADRLQGVAGGAFGRAVVEEQGGAALGARGGAARARDEGAGGFADFGDLALGERQAEVGGGLLDEVAVLDVALEAGAAAADELADRQGVEEFVGQQDQRACGQGVWRCRAMWRRGSARLGRRAGAGRFRRGAG